MYSVLQEVPEYRYPLYRSTGIRFKKVILLRRHPLNNIDIYNPYTEILNLRYTALVSLLEIPPLGGKQMITQPSKYIFPPPVTSSFFCILKNSSTNLPRILRRIQIRSQNKQGVNA
jgi:hypothetical protein